MQNPGKESAMGELHEMLNKLNNEADKLSKQIDAMRKKGLFTVRQAESVLTENMKDPFAAQAKTTLLLLVERLIEMNCHIELADDESPSLTIPYMPIGSRSVELKFLAGDNPWNFWLIDKKVNIKTLYKNLLKKHQNDLLEPYSNPKSKESVCFLDRNKVFRGIVLQTVDENRVKVWDCDSNISKVVLNEKIFKADPDACCVHAAAIKCTIQKEQVNTDKWSSDLRDLFCNFMKEAILNVRIVEKLPCSFPTFLVDVELKNEDDDVDGNLQEWILNRLLPELGKLTIDDSEYVCDFISSEALNPYYKDSLEVIKNRNETFSSTNIPVSRESTSEEDNNLNLDTDNKVPVKCFPNISSEEEEKNVLESSPRSEETIVLSSDSGMEVPVISKSNAEKEINQPTGFGPIKPEIFVEKKQQVPSSVFVQYPHMPPPLSYQNPYRYPPPPFRYQNTNPYNSFHNLPPHVPWFSGAHLTQTFPIRSVPPPPVMPSRVNVMAPNFVPSGQLNSEHGGEGLQNTFTKDGLKDSATAMNNGIVHMELKKPSSLLKPGENLVVMISHVVSPAEFYVHFITKNNQYLDKLKDDMFTHYNKDSKVSYGSWEEAKRELGEFCACKWLEDNHWYRVHVLRWEPIDNRILVYFVDYGNTDDVTLDCIQPLSHKFTILSMCAQLCHLAQVLSSTGRNQEWSAESIEYFKSRVVVNNFKVYSVTVIPSNDVKNNSLSVLLYEGKSSENYKSINEEMVECGFAWSKHFSTPPSTTSSQSTMVVNSSKNILQRSASLELESELESWDPLTEEFKSARNNPVRDTDDPSVALVGYSAKDEAQICYFYARDGFCRKPLCSKEHSMPHPASPELESELESWDPLTEEFMSARNNPARDTDDPSVALVGYSAKDEARICYFYARDGFCRKPLCSKEHSMPHPDGITTDKEEVFCRAFSDIKLPTIGDIVTVKVTSVSTINLFYVQLPQYRGSEIEEEEETLTLLTDFMNRPDNVMKMKYLRVPPAVGQLVLAKWDGTWYRARVVSSDDDLLEVMFVDYGSLSTVSEADLRDMEAQYLHLPFQAVECSLANITPLENTSSKYEEATETLRELIEGKLFEAKVYDSGDLEGVLRLQVVLQIYEGVDAGLLLASDGLCSLHQDL